MSHSLSPQLATLYEQDETAWLEQTATLVAQRRFDEIDAGSLCEYLSDMANRDRREVFSRLVVLLKHLLKWEHQPERRSNSWRGTIVAQRHDLRVLLESGTLRRHAEESLSAAHRDAIERAAAETGLPEDAFPPDCPWSLEAVLEPEASTPDDDESETSA